MDFPQASIVPGEPRASSALDVPSSPESQAAEHTKQLRTELFASTADWQSETKLAAALSMLQDLDAKILELRSLMPTRLLAPLVPIVDPNYSKGLETSGIPSQPPRTPQELFESLGRAARSGVDEVEAFKATWRGPQMESVWSRIGDELIEKDKEEQKKNGGQGGSEWWPQTTGLWERDYTVILQQLHEDTQRELTKQAEQRQMADRRAALAADVAGESHDGWRATVAAFVAREIPGIRVIVPPTGTGVQNDSSTGHNGGGGGGTVGCFTVLIEPLSIHLYVHRRRHSSSSGALDEGDWVVTLVPQSQFPQSRMADEIVQQLNARERKWELGYLLDMLSAYTNVKHACCHACGKLTDQTAQLPIVRFRKLAPAITTTMSPRNALVSGSGSGQDNNNINKNGNDHVDGNGNSSVQWFPYHYSCLAHAQKQI